MGVAIRHLEFAVPHGKLMAAGRSCHTNAARRGPDEFTDGAGRTGTTKESRATSGLSPTGGRVVVFRRKRRDDKPQILADAYRDGLKRLKDRFASRPRN